MKAKDLVGKTLLVNVAYMPLSVQRQAKVAYAIVKAVGYNDNTLIVNAGEFGWADIGAWDVVVEECKTYWYIHIEDIKEIL